MKAKSHNATTGSKESRHPTCVVCQARHYMWECDKFNSMSLDESYEVVRKSRLCLICFSSKHVRVNCNSKKYQCDCNRGHHKLLHRDSNTSQKPSAPPAAELSHAAKPFEPHSMNVLPNPQNHNSVARLHYATNRGLLTTVLVLVKGKDGSYHECRALLDQGSDTNFISAKMKKLGLPMIDHTTTVSGIDGKTTQSKNRTEAIIGSRYGNFELKLPLVVLPQVTGDIPSQRVLTSEIGDL